MTRMGNKRWRKVEAEVEVKEDDKGPTVLKSEMLAAMKEMKEGKAGEVDKIPAEMWKRMEDKALIERHELCQKIYEDGKWPDDCNKSCHDTTAEKEQCNRMQ